MARTIGNPLSWTAASLLKAGRFLADVEREMAGSGGHELPALRKLTLEDIRIALARGWDDFRAMRTDAIAAVMVYPVIGLVLVAAAFHRNLLPYVFPLVSGFMLLGPVALAGLYELSRRRERGEPHPWTAALGVLASPAIGAILALGLYLLGLFVLWIALAGTIYQAVMGDAVPPTAAAFLARVLTTPEGWALIVLGGGAGLALAMGALAMSVVTVPLMLDRHVGVAVGVATSVALFRNNPAVVLAWGFTLAAITFLGALPLMVGLIVALPVAGHASWHFYRRAVV